MIITQEDYFYVTVYLLGILLFLFLVRAKTLTGSTIRKYFLPAFMVKVVGAIAIGIVFQYFYGYGDTFGYFNIGKLFLRALNDGAANFSSVFFTGDRDFYTDIAYVYNFQSWYAFTPQTIIVGRISALFSLLGGGYYLTTALFFALFAFGGLWQLYRTFVRMFPKLFRELAWFTLFIPSVFFWGSGLLKDSLSIGALGFLTFGCHQLFLLRRHILFSLLLIIFNGYLILMIKPYILLSFVPAVLIWILFEYRKRIKNKTTRVVLLPIVFGLVVIGFGFFNKQISLTYEQLSLENITSTAAQLQQNIEAYDAGSSYNIGTIDASVGSFFRAMIPAMVVTLFRPFPWEINNLFSVLSAAESFFFLWFTIWTIRRIGIKRMFSTIVDTPVILFTFTYSIVFAIAVGIASQNFGTLVRYKIPCMPFYLIGVLLVNYYVTGEGLPFFRQKTMRKRRRRSTLVPAGTVREV